MLHSFSVGALLVAGTVHAAAPNLLQNGSFETGSFSGWTAVLGDTTTFVDGSASTGRRYDQATDGRWLAFFGSTRADGGAAISQTFATTAGGSYRLSFDLANSNGGSPAANAFSAAIGTNVLVGLSQLGEQDYLRYSAAFTATAAATTLTLAGFNDLSYLELDNVVIAAVPEPETAMLCLVGLLALVGARAWRRAG